ncbi:Armadillo repeat-containing protein [Ooceraea biroi]|uniref:Armadillo repeat-containing protein n=1 Tax=Ooceraea biroi TaxID=2015173 RepID=A0A026WFM2_OOCBI|nr:Armadillo repeat-containing protein [Ooceraea biroi]
MQAIHLKKKCDQQQEKELGPKQIEVDGSFNPALPNTKDINTAISLLQSKEEPILLAAVEALSKYASKSKDNIKILFDLDVVSKVLPVIEHEHLFIRRFAAKLLAEMIAVPDVMINLIESDYVGHFAKLLTNEKDTFMQEYFSAILAKLSGDPYGTALLANHCPNVDFLFEMIQSSDPDVKRNNMEILHNLMQDLVGARNISKTKGLSFSLLYENFESPYLEIQHLALDILADIIARNRDEDVQSLFRETNGIKVLLDFLENIEWVDLHIKALRILHLATENIVTADEFINARGALQIFNYAKRTANSNLFAEVFRIILHVANMPNGRQVLHSYEIIEYLLDALQRSTQSDIVEIICFGIGKMALYNPAAKELTNKKFIKTVLDLVKKEDLQWSARYAAVFALRQLLTSDIRNYDIFSDMHGQDYLLQLAKNFVEQVPVETCILALEVLIIIARHPTFKNILLNFGTVDTISTYPFIDGLKIVCCDLLSMLCLEKDGRQYFLKANGVQRLYSLITNTHSISVRNAAIQLVQVISVDLVAAKIFVENKLLSYMLNNRSFSRVIPSWDTCIETLFKSHLPMKFAFTGRLTQNDITQDGFYVLRRSVCPFPILDDIWQLESCSLEPIYVVNSIQSRTLNALQNKETVRGILTDIILNIFVENTTFGSNFERLQCDPHFTEYLEHFKCMILAAESKDVATDAELIGVPYVLSRAKTLARFVARQMCGLDPEIGCIDHQLEVHLKEIREHLETNIIPLGQLRVGSYLERALLFKAMADRLCLPVALVRGEYGISWVEIALPQVILVIRLSDFVSLSFLQMKDSDGWKTENMYLKDYGSKGFPMKLIKPNFIVDLMDSPGDLIPVGSHRAKLYCTKKMCNKMCYH